jgi:hypothetical protein
MRSTAFAAAVGSVVVLVGVAGAANASATIDLIWIDMTDTACTDAARKDCPQLGSKISSVAASDNITLAMIATAGQVGLQTALVSVNYGDALPQLSLLQFRNFSTEPFLPLYSFNGPNDFSPWIDNIGALSLPSGGVGLGLPARANAYLGSVSFHKNIIVDGTLDISVDVDSPSRLDKVARLFDGVVIDETTTRNSAFLIYVVEPAELAMLIMGVGVMLIAGRGRKS